MENKFTVKQVESLIVPCGWCFAGGVAAGGLLLGVVLT